MAMRDFNSLPTSMFNKKMQGPADKVYHSLFPGCQIRRFSEYKKREVNVIDKEFGIDVIIELPCKAKLYIQEKFRRNSKLAFGDFTQEFKNAAGTAYESDGEWFHLAADLYFYGWANTKSDGFVKWILLNVPTYKILVERAGGLDSIGGKLCKNSDHGLASFYGIQLGSLQPAIIESFDVATFQKTIAERSMVVRKAGETLYVSPRDAVTDKDKEFFTRNKPWLLSSVS